MDNEKNQTHCPMNYVMCYKHIEIFNKIILIYLYKKNVECFYINNIPNLKINYARGQ